MLKWENQGSTPGSGPASQLAKPPGIIHQPFVEEKNQSPLCEVAAVIALNDRSARCLSAWCCLNSPCFQPMQIFKVTRRQWACLKLLLQVRMWLMCFGLLVVFFFPRLTQTHFLIRRHCFDESSRWSSRSPFAAFVLWGSGLASPAAASLHNWGAQTVVRVQTVALGCLPSSFCLFFPYWRLACRLSCCL